MADNVAVTAGTGTTIAADEVVDGTLGTVKVQYVKLMDGTLDGTTKAAVGANGLKVDGSGATQPVSGTVTAAQATAANLNATVVGTGTFAVQAAATLAAETTKVIGTVNLSAAQTLGTVTNLSQMGGVAIALNTGVRSTGTQRVTIATDDLVPVNAAASAFADGSIVTLGTKADAKSTATDTTAVSAMQVWKQQSASLQTLAAASGTAGTPSATVNTVQGIANMTPVSNRERLISAASAQLVRPANVTAYTANDEISAASPASLSVTVSDVNDDPVTISEILVSSTDTGFGGKNIRVWVYNGATTAGTDNGAFSSARANFVGTFSGSLRAASDGCVGRLVPDEGTSLVTLPASGAKTLQLRVQTLDAATPSANSTTFDFAAKGIQGRAA